MTKVSDKELEQAYANQKKFITKQIKAKGIAGYKAAASSKKAQENLGIDHPLSGVLYANGRLENNSEISLKNFTQGKIETEVGYILGKDITQQLTSDNISDFIESILPVLEIPDVKISPTADVSITDMIEANTFSAYYLCGTPLPASEINPNDATAKLYLDEELLNEAPATDAMGNQWQALKVVLNMVIKQGYSPKKGDLIITGALGNILAMKPGLYTSDYGLLGKLSLTVTT